MGTHHMNRSPHTHTLSPSLSHTHIHPVPPVSPTHHWLVRTTTPTHTITLSLTHHWSVRATTPTYLPTHCPSLPHSPLVGEGHHTLVSRARYDSSLWLLVEYCFSTGHHLCLDQFLSFLYLLTSMGTHCQNLHLGTEISN